MGTSLGMSTGAAGVSSALVKISPNGAQHAQFRFLSADQSHSDLGDLVRSSISLMTTQVPAAPAAPDALAVTYRTPKQAHAIRNAVSRQRHRVHLVPEAVAALSYLRHTGEIAQYATVAIADFGDSGLSVVVADQMTGEVIHADRTNDFSGRGIDDLLYGHVVGSLPTSHPLRYLDRALLSARCRVAKEQLSSEPNAYVDVDLQGNRPVEISRTTFDEIAAPAIRIAVDFIHATVASSPRPPDALALLGGMANIPAIKAAVTDAFTIGVVPVAEPDTVTAKGAALMAVSPTIDEFPAIGSNRMMSVSKTYGALACALVAGAFLLGFGVYKLTPPSAPDVFPTGTDMFHATEHLTTSPVTPTTSPVPSHDPALISEHSGDEFARHTFEPQVGDTRTPTPDSTTPSSATQAGVTKAALPTPTEAIPAPRMWPHIVWPATPPRWPLDPRESTQRNLVTLDPEVLAPNTSPHAPSGSLPIVGGSGNSVDAGIGSTQFGALVTLQPTAAVVTAPTSVS
ncbi:Hsp70 family protein [Rhodococcus sp. NPDC049939]|uniref:Hsp70 family protein n=1 Tax=Rhodococcus sp. NPDC049939 TaxID=3155511 RepID=UPI0033E060F7